MSVLSCLVVLFVLTLHSSFTFQGRNMQETEKIEELGFEDMMEACSSASNENTDIVTYNDTMIVAHNIFPRLESKEGPLLLRPTRTKFAILFLCTKGSTTVRCNSHECRIQANSLFVCKPGSVLQFLNGHLDQVSVVCSQDKPEGALTIPLQKLLPHYTELEALTVLRLGAHDSRRINTMMGFLVEAIKADTSLLFYHEAVKAQASALVFCFLNIFCSGLNLKNSAQHTAHYRQQDYVRQFMSLLSLHFREQRRVTFYSDQMHITPKYLGSIITRQTGRTISDWIDHFVVAEAKVLLGSSSLTIQEITYKLNFPNQSFFCKYFKSHTGMTPSGFRSHHE